MLKSLIKQGLFSRLIAGDYGTRGLQGEPTIGRLYGIGKKQPIGDRRYGYSFAAHRSLLCTFSPRNSAFRIPHSELKKAPRRALLLSTVD